MSEHRERVDKQMSAQLNRRVFIPLLKDLGARYLVKPYLGKYDDELKSIRWGLGHKKHGDKRHRSGIDYQGIQYRDGEKTIGVTRQVVVKSELMWSRKHDNRLVQNSEVVNQKKVTYDEEFNKIRSRTSLDLLQRFTTTARGEIAGIGGSVTSTTEARAHTEVETEQFNHKKTENVLDVSAKVEYPGPLYRVDLDADGKPIGRTLVEEGPIWYVERNVETIHTITPIEQWGIWDCAVKLNLEDWAGNYGVLPDGEHSNVFEFASLRQVLAFLDHDLVLQYRWLPRLRLGEDTVRGREWLRNEANRLVGPVQYDQISVNENVAALEPTVLEPVA